MTIREAAELVIQASKLANGGDLFLLDMGKPIKITEIAKKMITLSGLKVKNKNNKEGIEIKFIGLRPGEKLFEELLIDSKAQKTDHPLIFKAQDSFMDVQLFGKKLLKLEESLFAFDEKNVLRYLKQIVPEWQKKIE